MAKRKRSKKKLAKKTHQYFLDLVNWACHKVGLQLYPATKGLIVKIIYEERLTPEEILDEMELLKQAILNNRKADIRYLEDCFRKS